MLNVLLTSLVAFLITFFTIPAIIIIAAQKKLYDVPDVRKLHTKPIASLGGIGIFGGFFMAALLTIAVPQNPEFQYYFAAATAIFFLGIKDDILILSAVKKFVVQLLAASILIHFAGLQITSMHGLLGFTELPPAVGIALTYISIIVIVNAFNLIDGVDGLAGSLGLLATLLFGTYFYAIGLQAYALFAFAMSASLTAFLYFNFNPAKIFMGDSGSLLLGLVNAILVLKFISIGDAPGVAFPIESVVPVGFAVLMVPLADTLRVFSIRIFKGRSPFAPDRNHIHHLLLDKGLSHKQVTLCCLLLSGLFISVAYFGRHYGPTYVMLTLILIAGSFLAMLSYIKSKKLKVVAGPVLHKHRVPSVGQTSTIVSMAKEVAIAEN